MHFEFFHTISFKARIVAIAVLFALLLGALYLLRSMSENDGTPLGSATAATNFVEAGTLRFETSTGQDTPYFEYGTPPTRVQLMLDAESVCATPTGALPCMAMSVQYSIVFGNKQAIVEAVENSGVITVKKLRILAEGEEARLPDAGAVFISWPRAAELMRDCKVTAIMQAHSLSVALTLTNGDRVQTVEPSIDSIFPLYEEMRPICGEMQLATE